MSIKAQFQAQESSQTLRQGLDEFYAINSDKFERPVPDTEWTELLQAHDACHVLFGLNTTLVEEALGDMWTLCGTSMTFKDYAQYTKSDAAKELIKGIGFWNIVTGTLKAIPGAVKVYLLSRKMSKKWEIWKFADRLDEKLVDLRRELNLKILTL